MQHIGRFLRRAERLWVGRAQRHQSGLETFPHRGIGIGFLEVHVLQRRDALQIGQRRHVHDRQARQLGRGDLDHQHANGVIGVLRLLHGEADEVIALQVDLIGRGRIQFAGQIAGEDRAVVLLVAQLDADFGTVAVDQLRSLLAADQGHVVTGHQQLGCQQRAVGGSKNQDIARHVFPRERFGHRFGPENHGRRSC